MASEIQRSFVPAWRILIAGGGAAGLSLGLALKTALDGAVAVSVFDPAFGATRTDTRAYAVSPAIARMLDGLGVWAAIRDRAQPIRRMSITDSRLDDVLRPNYLSFAGEAEAPLGFMVEAEVLLDQLRTRCRDLGVELVGAALTRFEADASTAWARQPDGTEHRASLVVAADGARSRLRDEAGIAWLGHGYGQSGIAATIAHERDHAGVATQHFLPSGPFAILPLVPGGGALPFRSSLVWTERSEAVPPLLALDPGEAGREIERRAGPHLGAVALMTPLRAHPLGYGQARRTVARRFALLGDAAHQVHPLAGQGLNLGLADAASLAEHMVDAIRLGLDPGANPVLEGYERDRRAATLAMAASTDALNRLFSTDALPVRLVRDLGLGLVDRAPALKRLFIGGASEGTGRAPRLLRGEAL
jgi:2-octaprenyl-6-methoxyphenol hydroxylase